MGGFVKSEGEAASKLLSSIIEGLIREYKIST